MYAYMQASIISNLQPLSLTAQRPSVLVAFSPEAQQEKRFLIFFFEINVRHLTCFSYAFSRPFIFCWYIFLKSSERRNKLKVVTPSGPWPGLASYSSESLHQVKATCTGLTYMYVHVCMHMLSSHSSLVLTVVSSIVEQFLVV